ncbi:MAG: hypothetical protein PHT33_15350 [bacterium]|nr:hypothetical protein [bacterium]
MCRCAVVLLLMTLTVILDCSAAYCHQFRVLTHVKDQGSLSIEQLKGMGTDAVWFYSGLPVKIDVSGKAVWTNEEARRKIEATLAYFEGSGQAI